MKPNLTPSTMLSVSQAKAICIKDYQSQLLVGKRIALVSFTNWQCKVKHITRWFMETVALMSFERPFERSIIKSDGRQHLILFQQIYQTKYFGRLLDLLNKQVFIISSEHIFRSAIRAAKISNVLPNFLKAMLTSMHSWEAIRSWNNYESSWVCCFDNLMILEASAECKSISPSLSLSAAKQLNFGASSLLLSQGFFQTTTILFLEKAFGTCFSIFYIWIMAVEDYWAVFMKSTSISPLVIFEAFGV